jgi:hypothetical protein
MCTFNILYDLKAAYRNIRKKGCIQEQQQEMLAQASILVSTMGLPGRPPTAQFPALLTKQDTGCRAKRTMREKIRFSGWDTLLRPEDTKSYLPRRPYMRQTCDLIYVKGI